MKLFNTNLKAIFITMICSFIAGSCAACMLTCSYYKHNPIIEYYEFNVEQKEEKESWRYDMLPCEMSDYICDLSEQLGLDSDLVVAILLRENPEINPNALHLNENGTTDCGIMQLNSAYIYSVFVPAYWKIDEEFNPFNWKMNIYLASKHIAYLCKELKVLDDSIAAYNCGAGRVMSGSIPDSTKVYVAAVKNNYRMLKESNGRE